MQPYDSIILAGGLGTRLKGVVHNLPKPMAPINGQPFLFYLLNQILRSGLKRVILSVGYKAGLIEEHFGSEFKDLELTYSREKQPLGTGGAIKKALQLVQTDSVFIFNGDTLFDCGIHSIQDCHHAHGADITIGLKSKKDSSRYGRVSLDSKGKVTSFEEKQPGKAGLINAGIYLINKKLMNVFPSRKSFSLEKDFFEPKLKSLNIWGIESDGYFIDIGIPEDYRKAQIEFKRMDF